MTGSAKQSRALDVAPSGLLRRFAPRNDEKKAHFIGLLFESGSQNDGDGFYLSRVTVEAGSAPGSSRSADSLGIASITSMPRVWQIFCSPAGNAASVTKVWIWLRWAMRTGALRRSLVLSATSITLRALAIMAWAACTSR